MGDRSCWPETVHPAPHDTACEVTAEIISSRELEPCGACHGEAGWTCLGCDGKQKTVCAGCMGAGIVDCPDCGTRGASCRTCGGEGRIVCRKCRGEGEVQCKKCGGEGTVKCLECLGEGDLVHYRQVVAEYLPDTKRFHQYNDQSGFRPSDAWFGIEMKRLRWMILDRILPSPVNADEANGIDPENLPGALGERIIWELRRLSEEAGPEERVFLTGYSAYKYPMIQVTVTNDDRVYPAVIDAHTGEVQFEKDPLVRLAEKIRLSLAPLGRRNGPSAKDIFRRYNDLKLLAAVLPDFNPDEEPMPEFIHILADTAYRVAASCPNQGRVANAHLNLYFSLRPDLNRKRERKAFYERFRNGMNLLDRSSFMSQKSEPLWRPGDIDACFRVLDRYLRNLPEVCSFLSAPVEERRRWPWKARFF